MKVKDLIKKLKECDQEAYVIMASDGEGNEFHPMDAVIEAGIFDKRDEYPVEEADENTVPAVFVWPGYRYE